MLAKLKIVNCTLIVKEIFSLNSLLKKSLEFTDLGFINGLKGTKETKMIVSYDREGDNEEDEEEEKKNHEHNNDEEEDGVTRSYIVDYKKRSFTRYKSSLGMLRDTLTVPAHLLA
jgi:ABC-type Zn2+ transport system substrate-binding protein/surface adhesin